MSTMNPFDILGADDNDDPLQLLAAAAVAKQKAEAKKPAAAAAGKGAQPAPAKLPTKPAPPAQEGSTEAVVHHVGDTGAVNVAVEEAAVGMVRTVTLVAKMLMGSREDTVVEVVPELAVKSSRTGRGALGHPIVEAEAEAGEAGTGMVSLVMTQREITFAGWMTRETEDALKLDEKAPVPEKQGAPEDAPQAEENKVNKDATANEEEEKEEDKEMTLDEFEKIREEKRKALLALKTEERKVEVDKDLQSMQPLSTEKSNEEGSDKDALKKKENAEREEELRRSVSINEFLKPAEGERYVVAGAVGTVEVSEADMLGVTVHHRLQ
ncbi:hypothetical protein ACP4OV_020197 [Aristida adscensionis]